MPDEYMVKGVWIEKHQNKDLFKLCIDGDVDTSNSIDGYSYSNVYINFTMEQLIQLNKEISKRIKKNKS